MADWRVRKRGDACSRCEREFSEGEPHYSLLLWRDGDLAREDLCEACFAARGVGSTREADAGEGEAEPPLDVIAYWRTRRREGGRAALVDFEMVETLFWGLGEREEEKLRELRYLLALLLVRKKRLKIARTARRDGAELLLLRRPRREEEVPVEVFDLAPDRAAALRGDLRDLLEGAGIDELLGGGDAGEGREEEGERESAEPRPDAGREQGPS